MAAPPVDGSSTTTPPLLVRMKKPLPLAIRLAMAIVWSGSNSGSTKTIGDHVGVDRFRFIMWILFISLPSTLIGGAAGLIYAILCDDSKGGRELISSPGGFCFVAILVLAAFVYNAVLLAAWSHLALFVPRTPAAAWEAFYKGTCCEGMGFFLMLISIGVGLLGLIDQPWPLLFLEVWIVFLVLLIASIVAFWLRLLWTYGEGGGGGGERRGCGEAFIDWLAYLYPKLLYQYAARLHPGDVAVADYADAGMQQHLLDADVVAVV